MAYIGYPIHVFLKYVLIASYSSHEFWSFQNSLFTLTTLLRLLKTHIIHLYNILYWKFFKSQ